MKTLLVSALLVIATANVFGQQRITPAQDQQATQSARTDSYQQPTSTQSYQQPVQNDGAQHLQPAVGGTNQQAAITQPGPPTDPIQNQKINPSSNNKDDKAADEYSKNGNKETEKKYEASKTHDSELKTIAWECPTCKRVFFLPGNYPADGKCPYDGAALIRLW